MTSSQKVTPWKQAPLTVLFVYTCVYIYTHSLYIHSVLFGFLLFSFHCLETLFISLVVNSFALDFLGNKHLGLLELNS